MANPIQTKDKYMVRFPDGMRNEIKASATKNNRSMNAEIIARLEGYSARDDLSEAIKSAMREVLESRNL